MQAVPSTDEHVKKKVNKQGKVVVPSSLKFSGDHTLQVLCLILFLVKVCVQDA